MHRSIRVLFPHMHWRVVADAPPCCRFPCRSGRRTVQLAVEGQSKRCGVRADKLLHPILVEAGVLLMPGAASSSCSFVDELVPLLHSLELHSAPDSR
jgi:hypothetical protein